MILCRDFDRPQWVRIAKVALHYSSCEIGVVRTECEETSRTNTRKEESPVDWQYCTVRGEWRQWETTISYEPMLYQVRLILNYG